MNMPPENDFAALRRLLSLKRHEQPPPGYFQNFSAQVTSALLEQSQSRKRRESPAEVPGWIRTLFGMLQARPGFAGATGAIACALVIGAVLAFEHNVAPPPATPSLLTEITPAVQPAVAEQPDATVFQPVSAELTPLIAETNVQLTPKPSLFDTIPGLETAPVGDRR